MKIKFSHNYLKLNAIDIKNKVRLVKLSLIMKEEQPKDFLNYDTGYYDDKGRKCYYNLKPGQHILLFFVDSKGTLFTTIRPFNLNKYSYYVKNKGCLFMVEVSK